MLRRLARWTLPALAIATAAALTSACTVTPLAASVSGDDISTASLNSELSIMSNAPTGGCLVQVELGNPDLTSSDVQGAGGTGTYSMSVTTGVLADEIGNRLVEQYAAAKGIGRVTAAERATAKSDYEADPEWRSLDGRPGRDVSEGLAAVLRPSRRQPLLRRPTAQRAST